MAWVRKSVLLGKYWRTKPFGSRWYRAEAAANFPACDDRAHAPGGRQERDTGFARPSALRNYPDRS